MKYLHMPILAAFAAAHLAGAENYLDLRARVGIAPGITDAETYAPAILTTTGLFDGSLDMGLGPMPVSGTVVGTSLLQSDAASTDGEVGINRSASIHYGFFVTDTFGFTGGTGLSLVDHLGDYESSYTKLDVLTSVSFAGGSSSTDAPNTVTLLTTNGSDYRAWGWNVMAGVVVAPTKALRIEGGLSYTRGRGEGDAGTLSSLYIPPPVPTGFDSYEYTIFTSGVPSVEAGDYYAYGLTATGLYTIGNGFTVGVDFGWQWASCEDTVTWEVMEFVQGHASGLFTVSESDIYLSSFTEERSLDAEGVTANLVIGYSF